MEIITSAGMLIIKLGGFVMSKSDQIKIVAVIVGIVVLLCVTAVVLNQDFTPLNSRNAVGNTAGNLYNNGLFCEKDGIVYFVYPADDNRIYMQNPDGSYSQTTVTNAFSLNVYGKYLYYSKNSLGEGGRNFLDGLPFGIYRMRLKDGRTKSLSSSLSPYICLVGSNIFFQEYTDTSLYFTRVNIRDKKNTERISTAAYIPVCAEDGYLYLNEVERNHNIYRYDTETGAKTLFFEGNTYQCIYTNGYLYFIDLADGYALKKVNMATQETTVITSDRCINYNVLNDTVFYEIENPDTNLYGLFRNNTEGTNEEPVADVPCMNINMTTEYTYFQYFTDEETLYRTSTTGPIHVERFAFTVSD